LYNTETLIAKYSLGSHPDEMIEDYLNGIEYLENVGEEKYIDLLWMLSLGILLFKKACLCDREAKKMGVKIKLCLVYNKITKEAGNYG